VDPEKGRTLPSKNKKKKRKTRQETLRERKYEPIIRKHKATKTPFSPKERKREKNLIFRGVQMGDVLAKG